MPDGKAGPDQTGEDRSHPQAICMEVIMRLRLIGAAGLGLLLTALTATAVSATTNTVAIGSPVTVTDRVLVTVPVTIVCDPLPNTPFQSEVSVTVEQASSSSVSNGTGQSFPSLTCDGVTQNSLMVDVTPNSGSGPFHGGGAIVSASFFYATAVSCGSGCFFMETSESGSTGPTAVSVRG
jgi:hypothetical protein